MSLTKGRRIAGTNKQVKRGAIGKSEMKNGEEVIQYHNGRLKVVRKEFGKMFELEFVQQKGPAEQKELRTFAKNSDVKKPQKDAIKFVKDGVRISKGKKTFFQIAEEGDSGLESGDTQLITSGANAGKMLIP
jgi:DNA repair exonuclease SbcCD nuclease subunit